MKIARVLITALLVIHTANVLGDCKKCGSEICCCEFSDFKTKYPHLFNFVLTMINENYEFAAYLFQIAVDNPVLATELNTRAAPDPWWGVDHQIIEIKIKSGYDAELK